MFFQSAQSASQHLLYSPIQTHIRTVMKGADLQQSGGSASRSRTLQLEEMRIRPALPVLLSEPSGV